jgi:ABC-type dipeptide/oligopeptide/nickel transport system permease component
MLGFAVRRILLAIPTVFGISLVVFFVTTLVPDPSMGAAFVLADPHAAQVVDEQRRARFLDLPRFFNSAPHDVDSRADRAIAHLAADDARAPEAARTLARLGGAALPHVLPALEALAPDARGRVAVALAPVAVRMGLAREGELTDPSTAIPFWTHFWEDRSLDFTDTAVRRAVSRLVERGTDLREHDLLPLDTYALPAIMDAMPDAPSGVVLERLTRLAVHFTGRGIAVDADAGPTLVRRARADWREYWYVHRLDFVRIDGTERLIAPIGETRYGKWVLRAATGNLGLSQRDGEPIADKLLSRTPVTLGIALLAMFASYALAVPLGAYTAWRRQGGVDLGVAAVLFILYALPTFWLAEVLRRAFPGLASDSNLGASRFVLPIVTLTLGSLATLARYQRTAMLDVIGQDYVRTARAKGVSTFRWVVVHALRNALLPTVTLAGLQLPLLIGGAFVVEEIYAIPGLGYETLRAIESHDTSWLLAMLVVCAVVTTGGIVASDIAYGMLDPRIRDLLARRSEVPL